MKTFVAAKRLSRVEVSADASNQHEFHAGQLRKALGLPAERTEGDLDITYVLSDSADTEGETCRYTFSNVRAKNPRRDEFHMYYTSRRLQDLAAEGDILVLTRKENETEVRALIARRGTDLANGVAELLAEDGVDITTRFKSISANLKWSRAAEFFGTASDTSVVPSAEEFLAFVEPGLLESDELPSGRAMAQLAGSIVERMSNSLTLDPDTFLQWRIDAETTLFQHLERAIGQRQLDELAATSGTIEFGDAAALVLRHLQSRRSRRGQSLQNHFAALLAREGIPFREQCRTEHGERPDFLIPGCSEYANPNFPSSHLRMVACKSVLRERWDQILNEAARIPEKYLLTLDVGLTDSTIASIRRSAVRLFLPSALAEAAYRHHTSRNEIGTVAQLLDHLRVCQQAT